MLSERKRRTTDGKPAELAGFKPEVDGRRRFQYQRCSPAVLGHYAFQAPGMRERATGLDQSHPDEQGDEGGRHQSPEDLLPQAAHVLVNEEDMPERADNEHERAPYARYATPHRTAVAAGATPRLRSARPALATRTSQTTPTAAHA